MDLDGDGHRDVISGSYWPGHISWFRGLGDGKFEKGRELVDVHGKPLHAGQPWKSEKKPDLDSLAAAPWMIDWDDDGDLDLLVGNIAGHVVLIRNEGTRSDPKFGTGRELLQAGDAELEVAGGDAGPTMADWDVDGRVDLIVGAGDGSVIFCRNEAEVGFRFATGVVLIPGGAGHGATSDGGPERSGSRSKPHVVDWDGDGKLDLLVGDATMTKSADPELTEAQRTRRGELRLERDNSERALEALSVRLQSEDASVRDPAQKEFDAILLRSDEVEAELRLLEGQPKMSGFVWWYRRL